MNGEAEILQHGIQLPAFDRGGHEAREWIRSCQDEKEEDRADQALHGQNIGFQRGRKICAEAGDQGAEKGQDQYPQEHGALVIAPGSGDPVEKRLQRMRIFPNADDREIGSHIGRDQGDEGQRRHGKSRHRDGAADRHHAGVARPCAQQRQHGLHQRQREGENECEMTYFDHDRGPSSRSCSRPTRPWP